MSEPFESSIKITLHNKQELVFENGYSYKQWAERFLDQWRWLNNTPARQTWQQIQGRIQNTLSQISNWEHSPQHAETIRNTRAVIESAISQIYGDTKGGLVG